MTRTASHAWCAIAETTTTKHVQNYAGSRIKRDIAESAPQPADTEDMCALFVQQ